MVNLKNLLNESKVLKEKYDQSPYDRDGWNKHFFDEIGFIDIANNIAAMEYEIKNARRGSHGISGERWEDFVDDIDMLHEKLMNLVKDVEQYRFDSE